METPPQDDAPAVAPSRTSAKRRAKFVAGGAGVALSLLALTFWAMSRPGSTAFYMTPTELMAAGPATSGDVRVNGKVVPGTIETAGLQTSFTISDGASDIRITTEQPMPDTFKEHSDVVARGRFDGNVLSASEVLAKCPSKFKAKA